MMVRQMRWWYLVALGLVAGLPACEETPGAECNQDGVCDAPRETVQTCPDDCLPVCDNDDCCDDGESCASCANDCCGVTCPQGALVATHDFIVESIQVPPDGSTADVNGVDLDGDGFIDNQLGRIMAWIVERGLTEGPGEALSGRISSGEYILIGRIAETDCNNGAALQLVRGEPHDGTPIFDGQDRVLFAADAPFGYLCASWTPPELDAFFPLVLDVPMANAGLLRVTLSAARVQTVEDPASPYFASSAVLESGWTDVMVGGGLSFDEIHHTVIPFFAMYLQDIVDADAEGAAAVVDTFDGRCTAMPDVPGCEDVVAGEGECDDWTVPPRITATELLCNAELRALQVDRTRTAAYPAGRHVRSLDPGIPDARLWCLGWLCLRGRVPQACRPDPRNPGRVWFPCRAIT